MKKTFSNQIKACCCAAMLFCLLCAFTGCNDESSCADSSQADESSSQAAVTETVSAAEQGDKIPPVVKAADMEVFAGDSVSYKKNIIVTDNHRHGQRGRITDDNGGQLKGRSENARQIPCDIHGDGQGRQQDGTEDNDNGQEKACGGHQGGRKIQRQACK